MFSAARNFENPAAIGALNPFDKTGISSFWKNASYAIPARSTDTSASIIDLAPSDCWDMQDLGIGVRGV